MMISITLNKKVYHKQMKFVDWCRENIGQGGWNPQEDCGNLWGITSGFGCTTMYFLKDKDRINFESAFRISKFDLI